MEDIIKPKRTAWNKGVPKTEEAKRKQRETVLKRYGVTNVFQIKEIKDKKKEFYDSGEFKRKVKSTNLERYGNENYNNREKANQTKKSRYGDSHYNNTNKHQETCLKKYGCKSATQTEEVRNKISETKLKPETQLKYETTMLERYGSTSVNNSPELNNRRLKTLYQRYNVHNPLQNKSIKNKQVQTLLKNSSFNKSKPEEVYYLKLQEQYDKEDIIRQYKDKRYPYCCDFYIKSKDLFIECNYHWTHGGRPYDPNDIECQEQLKLWQEKAKTSQFYKNAITTWTIRDVEKYNILKNNNLNYIVLYK